MKADELRALAERDDHDRGCEGRCYTCGCGYDARVEAALAKAADRIAKLEATLEQCAQIVERNLYRQHEKIEDVPKLARASLLDKTETM